MMPARVLYLNPTAQLGGAEYSLLDLAASLDRRRFEPQIACFGDGPLLRAARDRGIAIVALPLTRRFASLSLKGRRSGPAGLAAAAVTAVPLARRVRALAADADIVHTNGTKAHLLAGVAAPRATLVWHVRDFWRDGRAERSFVRLANSRARAVIANSGAVAAHLAAMGVNTDLLHAVPNGIDTARFAPDVEPAPLRAEFGWPLHAPLVGIAGMLARWKGQDVLLRAFADVLRGRPDVRCVVAGDEIYLTRGQTGFGDELRRLARELNIEHAVGFTGYREDVPALLRALDIVVHASVEAEPFGRVVAEAMACGRPVIATDAGGVPEVTGPAGASALLVPPRDAAALSRAIVRLLDDPGEAARMGTSARQRILAAFPLERHVEHVHAIYERLLSPARPAVESGAAAGSVL